MDMPLDSLAGNSKIKRLRRVKNPTSIQIFYENKHHLAGLEPERTRTQIRKPVFTSYCLSFI
jgi:hypothetical protein